MYAQHVPILTAAMRAEPHVFERGVMFAILSARVQFGRVPGQCKELRQRGSEARCLWGWKFDAYTYLQQHSAEVFGGVAHQPDSAKALWCLTRIPGLGIVKGAFVLQMLGHDTACLDARNIAREGLNPRAYRSDGEARKSSPAFALKIERYLDATAGRSEELWDRWCNEVGPDYGMTGEECSFAHVKAIVPPSLTSRPLYYLRSLVTHREIPF